MPSQSVSTPVRPREISNAKEACEKELWDLAGGNYTNYARWYLGSTLSFLKSQAFEYQCTHEVGKEGAGYISNAIGLGTIKHPELGMASNPLVHHRAHRPAHHQG